MAGGDYRIDFSAANPSDYPRILGSSYTSIFGPLPTGRDDSENLAGAEHPTNVESLAPGNLALGQIVPFFFEITVDDTAPVGDSITFTAGWNTVTNAGGNFGYDPTLGVLAAFVDSNDPDTVDDTNATVSNFSWTLVGNEIQGTIEVDNLDPGETIIVEAWLVLQDEIDPNVQGNTINSRLISAETSGTVESGETINTGNQTVPLQQINQFISLEADISVIKSDNPNIVTTNPDAQDPTILQIGDQFTYTIEVTNNSDEVVANGVILTDTLDPNVRFVSATVTDTEGFLTPDGNIVHDGSASGGTITGDLEFLNPGETVTVEVTVEILDTAPTSGDDSLANGDLINTVTVSSINDTNTDDNTDIEPTDVTPLGSVTVIKDADIADGTDFVFSGDLGDFTLQDGGSFNNSDLAAGTYTVTETDDPNFDLSNIVIEGDTDGGSVVDLATGTIDIDLDPNEDITVTFVNNQETGGITVIKDADVADGTDFVFSGDLGDFTLQDGGSFNNSDLAAGTYTVTETDDPNFDLSNIVIEGDTDGGSVVDLATGTIDIDLDPNEDITVTFNNFKQNPGIDIEKFTNGHNADTPEDAAEVAAGQTVTWTYEVTNTGNVSFDFDEIEVTDDRGVIPVLDVSTDVGGDSVLSPGETWTYAASGTAQDLNEVIDFEQFAAGAQDAAINAGLTGVTISTNWRNGLMIFDSANITGDPDDDLGTPNGDFGGPGNGPGGEAGKPGENRIPQSKVLILSQDGDPTDPNDAREGGTITFDWDTPVRLNQIGILDIDTYETSSKVTTYDDSGSVIGTYALQPLGDNSFQIVSIDDVDVSRMEVFFGGSGAITEIDVDNFYQNIGTVTVDGVNDSDSSTYFNPFVGLKDPAPQGEDVEPGTGSGGKVRYEAESLHLENYQVESKDFASNGKLVALSGESGRVHTTFNGTTGTYEMKLAAFDESDGESEIEVWVNGEKVGATVLNQNLGGTRAAATNQVIHTFELDLEEGDEISIYGVQEDGERARLDYFELHPTSGGGGSNPPEPTDDITAWVVEAEDLDLTNYETEAKNFASSGQLIALDGETGSAKMTFTGAMGNYELTVAAFDESDGRSPLRILVNGVEVEQWTLNGKLGGTRATATNRVMETFGVSLKPGDVIEIEGEIEKGERARLDFIQISSPSIDLVNVYEDDALISGGMGAFHQ